MKLKPTENRLLVKRLEGEERTAGGIIIPDTAKEKPMQGKVLATGPGKRKDCGSVIPMSIKEGDTVLFAKWSGSEVKVNGEDLLIMKDEDVLAIVE